MDTSTSASGSSTTTSTTTVPVVEPFPVEQVTVGDTTLTVWVAATGADRSQGLMEVEALPNGIDGMLFVFDRPEAYSFWMLNTLIPLDIWWIDEDGVLLGSTRMDPCEVQPCTSYPPPAPILYALETPAGVFGFDPGLLLRR